VINHLGDEVMKVFNMNRGNKIWIGADPGGKGTSGWPSSNPTAQPTPVAWTAPTKPLRWLLDTRTQRPPVLVWMRPCGVIWTFQRSSGRPVVENKIPLLRWQVQTANSLRGAALVQGAMFVQRMRNTFQV